MAVSFIRKCFNLHPSVLKFNVFRCFRKYICNDQLVAKSTTSLSHHSSYLYCGSLPSLQISFNSIFWVHTFRCSLVSVLHHQFPMKVHYLFSLWPLQNQELEIDEVIFHILLPITWTKIYLDDKFHHLNWIMNCLATFQTSS